MNRLLIVLTALLILAACREEPKTLETLECRYIDGIMVCPGIETENLDSLKYCRYKLISAEGKNCKEPRYLCMPCMGACAPVRKETINACTYKMELIETDCTHCFEVND